MFIIKEQEMSNNSSTIMRLLQEYGWVAMPKLSDAKAADIHTAFDQVIAYAENNPTWIQTFNEKSSAWKQAARIANMMNSGYFGPYYRDVRGGDKDNKVTYQTCNSFRSSCQAGGDAEIVLPQIVNHLDKVLFEALVEVLPSFSTVVDSIAAAIPLLKDRLVLDNGDPNVSVRVLKYFVDSRASTNPHVDKSALTYIMHTSDGVNGGSLTFASPSCRDLNIADFKNPAEYGAPLSNFGHVFPGEALSATGLTSLKATPHAALKPLCDQVRYSIVAFWLVKDVDLAPFSTKIIVRDDGVLRDY